MKHVVLLADNREEDRATWQRVLANADYDVRLAASPEEARKLLEKGGVDIAIIDLRLVDDNNENDISGLVLAKERAYRYIPKIILTAFNVGYSDLREVLGPIVDDLPPTVAFVKKDERPQHLLEVIRQALETWHRLRAAATRVSEQIKSDHDEARRQARLTYWATFGLSLLGAVIMFAGIGLVWLSQLPIGAAATTGGIIIEIQSYLFARANLANNRVDIYHRELLQTYWFEFLLAASEELPLEKRSACKERAIHTAIDNWLVGSPPPETPLNKIRKAEEKK